MSSSIPRISQLISRFMLRRSSRSLRPLLLRQLPFVGAAILILVSCTPSLAQSGQVGRMTTAPLSTDEKGHLTPFADRAVASAPVRRRGVPQQAATSISSSRDAIRKTLLRQPLHFEPNLQGGLSSRTLGRELRVDSGGRVQFGEAGKPSVSMLLEGANLGARPAGQDLLAGHSNYLLGNDPGRWRTGVSQFSRVRVQGVYPGIDLVYYGNGDQLEHDYLVAPNADPGQVQMQFIGAKPRLDAKTGDLLLQQGETSEDGIRLLRPIAYQVAQDGTRKAVSVSYRTRPHGEIGFSLGTYDHLHPLVIDPVILYASYFGGNYYDSLVDVKIGADGGIYLLMTTDSTDLKVLGNPPNACADTCGPNNPYAGSDTERDIYVAELDKTGQTLIFATYIGGSNDDQAFNLALDSDGSIYVTGTSLGSDFPQVNAYPGGQPADSGETTNGGVLSKLSADGSKLLYSTYIGFGLPGSVNSGLGTFQPHYMVTANNGIVYLLGVASFGDDPSTAFIWKTNPLFTVGLDFVAKVDTTQAGTGSIVYATQIGDANSVDSSTLSSLALDSKGDLWIYGESVNAAFPVTSADALQTQCSGVSSCNSGFLMELNPAGTAVLYSTFLGGTGGTFNAGDIRIDSSDNIYVSGTTSQSDYPIKNGAYSTLPNTTLSGYVSKISPDGETLLYSTYLQGTTDEIAVSSDGEIAFAGSSGPGYPVKNNLQTGTLPTANVDTVFGLIDTSQSGGDSLLISSYLGTTTSSTVPGRIEFSSGGQFLIVGATYATDLPVANAYQATCTSCVSKKGDDGFVVAIQPNNTLTLTPSTITFPSTNVGSTSAAMTATLFNGTTKSIYLIQGTLTDSTDFTQSNNCGGIMSPQASCTVTFTFTPQSAGTLTSTYSTGDLDNPSSPLNVVLNGTATGSTGQPQPQLTPATINFGSVAVGATSGAQAATLKNAGTAALTISSFGFFGTNASSFEETNTCGTSLAAGASCAISLTCAPTASGSLTANLGANFPSPIVQQSIALTCTGTGNAQSETLAPTSIDFGTVIVGQTATQTVTYHNNGPAAATIYNYSDTNSAFSVVGSTCTPNVAANASCTYTLQFAPTASGPQSSTFEVLDKSSNPSVALTGTTYISSPQITLTPNHLNFQNIPQGQSTQMDFTLTNSSTFPITFSYRAPILNDPLNAFALYATGGDGYCNYDSNGIATVTAGASCLFAVSFTGTIAPDITASATLTIPYSPPGTTTLYAVTGYLTANEITDAAPVVTPTTIQFPATPAGKTSPAQTVNVSNTGEEPLSFTSATFTGTNPTAFAQTNNCPASLNKGDSCQIAVTFTPAATGNEFSATLDVKLSTGDVNVALNGGTNPSDFILSTTAPTQYNPNATWTLNIAPLSASIGFNEPITFTVTGLDASYGTPVFTPSTVTPNAATVTTKLTLNQSPTAQLRRGSRSAIPVLACCMAFLLSFRKRLKSYRSRIAAMTIVFALAVFTLTGCAKSPFNFTVTATSGSISHDITLTLQP